MKRAKTISSILLVLALALSMVASVFAAETAKGSITIENPLSKQSYYVYRIFDLESYDKTNNAYSYTLNSAWESFAKQDFVRGVYLTLETSGGKTYVKWVEGADVNAFAKLAIAWAKAHTDEIFITDGITSTTTDAIVFEDLPLGYYLIDSSVGALCALTTNDPNAAVKEKNELTTIEKLVKENSTNDYGKENSAMLGDTVSFKSEVTLGEGTENLVVHDLMNNDLSLKEDSIKIYVQQTLVNPKNYTISASGVKSGVYQSIPDGCTFDIRFNDAYIATLHKGAILRIEYDAVVRWDAKEWTDFDNKTWVTFGDDMKSTISTTHTHTYTLDILKTDDKGIVIGTANFYLYDAQTGGNIIPLVALSEDPDAGIYRYRVATKDDQITGNGAVIKAGYAYIYGLDKQVYYLEETQQPAGFNKLSERVQVDLTNGSITADKSGNFYGKQGKIIGSDVANAGGLQVINRSGTLLPGTGGVGTRLLYAIGGILVVSAGILLVTKKRLDEDQPKNR